MSTAPNASIANAQLAHVGRTRPGQTRPIIGPCSQCNLQRHTKPSQHTRCSAMPLPAQLPVKLHTPPLLEHTGADADPVYPAAHVAVVHVPAAPNNAVPTHV